MQNLVILGGCEVNERAGLAKVGMSIFSEMKFRGVGRQLRMVSRGAAGARRKRLLHPAGCREGWEVSGNIAEIGNALNIGSRKIWGKW